MYARLTSLPLMLALAACSSGANTTAHVASAETTQTIATLPASGADPALLLVDMPGPGGAVTDFRETAFSNGLRQVATLEGGVSGLGRNQIEIAVETRPSNTDSVNISRPTEGGVRREILTRFPGVEMRILTQPRSNGLGVFGLAIGRTRHGARCAFAWQWVDDIRKSGDRSVFARFGGEAPAPASIRVHMCRTDATVDDLAATIEGMTRAAPTTIARALDPARRPSLSPVQGRAARTTGAVVDGTLESALGPAPALAAAAPKAAPTKVARKPARVARKRAPAVETPRPEPVQQSFAPMAGGGPRYLAPVPGQPLHPSAPPVAAVSPPARALDPSLPAAAYRGPLQRVH